MSSHHFVKEGQEPALFILDPLPLETAGPLLEWAPLVMVSYRALEEVLSWNIKIDVVLLEEEIVDELSKRLEMQAPLTILSCSQNESPLIAAANYLISKKVTAVNVVTSSPERAMQEMEKFTDRLEVTIMDEKLKWSAIPSGRYEKWITAETFVFVKKKPEQIMQVHGLREINGAYQSTATGIVSLGSAYLFWVGEYV